MIIIIIIIIILIIIINVDDKEKASNYNIFYINKDFIENDIDKFGFYNNLDYNLLC